MVLSSSVTFFCKFKRKSTLSFNFIFYFLNIEITSIQEKTASYFWGFSCNNFVTLYLIKSFAEFEGDSINSSFCKRKIMIIMQISNFGIERIYLWDKEGRHLVRRHEMTKRQSWLFHHITSLGTSFGLCQLMQNARKELGNLLRLQELSGLQKVFHT